MPQANFAKLDTREEHFWIPSHHEGLSLFLRYLPALKGTHYICHERDKEVP